MLAFLGLRGRRGVDVDEICLALGVGPGVSGWRPAAGRPRPVPEVPALRGARGGAEGLSDLFRALEVVIGLPFDRERQGGWAWLSSGHRVDVYMAVAIADVALTVTIGPCPAVVVVMGVRARVSALQIGQPITGRQPR